jgi:hypothetical protein
VCVRARVPQEQHEHIELLLCLRYRTGPLHESTTILGRYRVDNIPLIVEHPYFGRGITSALTRVAQSVFACSRAAVDRGNAITLEYFPSALPLPASIA